MDVLPIVGVVDDDRTTELCHALLETDAAVITCDASTARVDLGLISALARLHLTARRAGRTIEVRGSAELQLLVELVGLADLLPVASGGERG